MKLIDLLVQELPKRGGWPAGSACCCQSLIDTEIYFYDKMFEDGNVAMILSSSSFYPSNKERVHSGGYEYVSLQQYEAALKALEKFEWDGKGLPPVGVECEFNDGMNPWTLGVIKYTSEHSIVIELKEPGRDGDIEPAFRPSMVTFRPLRTDVERKREETIASMIESLECSHYELDKGAAEIILDAIAQGKVSGIKLAD